jgi:hypothetical protein
MSSASNTLYETAGPPDTNASIIPSQSPPWLGNQAIIVTSQIGLQKSGEIPHGEKEN